MSDGHICLQCRCASCGTDKMLHRPCSALDSWGSAESPHCNLLLQAGAHAAQPRASLTTRNSGALNSSALWQWRATVLYSSKDQSVVMKAKLLSTTIQRQSYFASTPESDNMEKPLAHSVFAELMQALCFMAGANCICNGDKTPTPASNDRNEDMEMMGQLCLSSRAAFLPYIVGNTSTGDASCLC